MTIEENHTTPTTATRPRAVAVGLLAERVDCCILPDGRRLITKRGELRALRGIDKGTGSENSGLERYLARLPGRFAHLATEPGVPFALPNGQFAIGFTPKHFVAVLTAYAECNDEGELHPKQVPIAKRASALLRLLAEKGIEALIDEACGVRPALARAEYRPLGGEAQIVDVASGRTVGPAPKATPGEALKALVCEAIDRGKPGAAIAFLNAGIGAGIVGPFQLELFVARGAAA